MKTHSAGRVTDVTTVSVSIVERASISSVMSAVRMNASAVSMESTAPGTTLIVSRHATIVCESTAIVIVWLPAW